METKIQVYCGTYRKYNSGSLKGEWINLLDYDSKDEFIEYCLELHDDEKDPELMYQDTDNLPDAYYSESSISEEFWSEYMPLLKNYDADALNAYLNNYKDLKDFEESYQGAYNSDIDFAQEMAESCGLLEKNVSWPYNCIDWEWAARELMYDYFEGNGYYFRNL